MWSRVCACVAKGWPTRTCQTGRTAWSYVWVPGGGGGADPRAVHCAWMDPRWQQQAGRHFTCVLLRTNAQEAVLPRRTLWSLSAPIFCSCSTTSSGSSTTIAPHSAAWSLTTAESVQVGWVAACTRHSPVSYHANGRTEVHKARRAEPHSFINSFRLLIAAAVPYQISTGVPPCRNLQLGIF